MVPDLLLATTNAGKLREIRGVLAGLAVAVSHAAGLPRRAGGRGRRRDVRRERARKGAALRAGHRPLVVAEDSGLEIDALDRAPGVQSARFARTQAPTYPEKFTLIYRLIREQSGKMESTARFVCALALAEPGWVIFEAEGRIEGQITEPPRGAGGFGYDPIFYYPPFDARWPKSTASASRPSATAARPSESCASTLSERWRSAPALAL